MASLDGLDGGSDEATVSATGDTFWKIPAIGDTFENEHR
jgi:hypothetical protein